MILALFIINLDALSEPQQAKVYMLFVTSMVSFSFCPGWR
jgi:hypothetical protein